MDKVECRLCAKTGYTASPKVLVCKCGGKFKVVQDNGRQQKVVLDEETIRRFDTSSLIKKWI